MKQTTEEARLRGLIEMDAHKIFAEKLLLPLPPEQLAAVLDLLNTSGISLVDLVDTLVNSPGGAAERHGFIELSPGIVAYALQTASLSPHQEL